MQTNESYRDHVNSSENIIVDVCFIFAKIFVCISGALAASHLVGSIFDKCTNASKDTFYASKTVED